MPLQNRQARPRSGFTLVEAVCTIVVIGIIGVASSGLLFAASDQYMAAASRGAIGAALSAAMERVAIEVRQIPAAPGTEPTRADIRGVSPSSLSWIDAEGVERTLSHIGTQLILSEGVHQYVLLHNVSAFSVLAFDESNDPLPGTLTVAEAAPVWRISMSITVTRQGESETLRSRFFLRCLMEGGAP